MAARVQEKYGDLLPANYGKTKVEGAAHLEVEANYAPGGRAWKSYIHNGAKLARADPSAWGCTGKAWRAEATMPVELDGSEDSDLSAGSQQPAPVPAPAPAAAPAPPPKSAAELALEKNMAAFSMGGE